MVSLADAIKKHRMKLWKELLLPINIIIAQSQPQIMKNWQKKHPEWFIAHFALLEEWQMEAEKADILHW